jgi:hypothetical protein
VIVAARARQLRRRLAAATASASIVVAAGLIAIAIAGAGHRHEGSTGRRLHQATLMPCFVNGVQAIACGMSHPLAQRLQIQTVHRPK